MSLLPPHSKRGKLQHKLLNLFLEHHYFRQTTIETVLAKWLVRQKVYPQAARERKMEGCVVARIRIDSSIPTGVPSRAQLPHH